MRVRFFVYLIMMGFLINSCKKNITIEDIETFEDTPAWELAQAVNKQNIEKIKEIATENKSLLDYQEPKLGFTLLMWAVSKEKFKSAEALLVNGANPNIRSKSGASALFNASRYSWEDVNADKDPKFVKLLLRYGTNPNIKYDGVLESSIEKGTTPLMIAVGRSFEKTKVLVEAGADINAKTETGKTAASEAFLDGLGEALKSAHYLIVKKGAKINEPYYFYKMGVVEKIVNYERPHYPIESLRDMYFDLGSKEYKMKMEIVEAAKKQGQDYWSTPITEFDIKLIKQRYPNNWQEYLERY